MAILYTFYTLLENLKLCPKIQFSELWIWIFELKSNNFWKYLNAEFTKKFELSRQKSRFFQLHNQQYMKNADF